MIVSTMGRTAEQLPSMRYASPLVKSASSSLLTFDSPVLPDSQVSKLAHRFSASR